MLLDLRAFLVTERCRRDRQSRVLSRKMEVVVGSRSHRQALPEESAQAFTPSVRGYLQAAAPDRQSTK